MEVPEWLKSSLGLVGQMLAKPTRGTRSMLRSASYLGLSFTGVVIELCNEGIAKPLKELSESKLQKIKSIDLAEAAEAHNKADAVKLEAESEAELKLAQAEKTRAEARAIDAQAGYERLKEERKLARAKSEEAKANLEAAVTRLRLKGGDLYLDSPDDSKPTGAEESLGTEEPA